MHKFYNIIKINNKISILKLVIITPFLVILNVGVIIILNYNQKEILLLQDEKNHEQTCVNKYTKFTTQACAQELKDLFSNLAQKEQQHLNYIDQLISGTVPTVDTSNKNPVPAPTAVKQSSTDKEADKQLLSDALETEKYISSTYNTAVFEFKDENVRNVLNTIQKQEQAHGFSLYNYMAANGMYS